MKTKAGLVFLSMWMLLFLCDVGFAQDDLPSGPMPETKHVTVSAPEEATNAPGESIDVVITYDAGGLSNPSDIEVSYYFTPESPLEFVKASVDPDSRQNPWKWSQLRAPSGSLTTTLRLTGAGGINSVKHIVRLRESENGGQTEIPVYDWTQTRLMAVPEAASAQQEIADLRLEPDPSRAGDSVVATVVFTHEVAGDLAGYTIQISSDSGEPIPMKPLRLVPGSDSGFPVQFSVPGTWEDGSYDLRAVLRDEIGTVIAEGKGTLIIENPTEPEFSLQTSVDVAEEAGQSRWLSIAVANEGSWPGGEHAVWLQLQVPAEDVTILSAKQNKKTLEYRTDRGESENEWVLQKLDWRNPNAEILIEVLIEPGFSAASSISAILNADNGQQLGQAVFSSSELNKLRGPVQTATPNATSTVYATDASAVGPVEQETEQKAAPTPEADGEAAPAKVPDWRAALFAVLGLATAYLLYRRLHPSETGSSLSAEEHSRGTVYLSRADTGDQIPLTSFPFTIGRASENSLAIDESFVEWQTISRYHAVIIEHPSGYVIEDLGSRNGISVEGRMTPKNLLRDGWRIDIGGVCFIFQLDDSQESATV